MWVWTVAPNNARKMTMSKSYWWQEFLPLLLPFFLPVLVLFLPIWKFFFFFCLSFFLLFNFTTRTQVRLCPGIFLMMGGNKTKKGGRGLQCKLYGESVGSVLSLSRMMSSRISPLMCRWSDWWLFSKSFCGVLLCCVYDDMSCSRWWIESVFKVGCWRDVGVVMYVHGGWGPSLSKRDWLTAFESC